MAEEQGLNPANRALVEREIDQREEGPEECAETDISYWEEE